MNYATRVAVVGLIGGCCAGAAVRAEPVESKCIPVPIAAMHPLPRAGASPFLTTQRLARIENDTVACLDRSTLEPGRCTFRTEASSASGDWVEDPGGVRYAPIGQAAESVAGRGGYIVAATVEAGGVPCAGGARSRDMAGVSQSQELAEVCAVEVMGAATNASRRPLRNYATLPVCTSSYPHPDGARLHSADRASGVYCYIGEGAGLNDPGGRERDRNGVAFIGNYSCHVGWSGGFEVWVAKRPRTLKAPAPGIVDTRSPIVWRPVTAVRVAN